MQNILYGSYQDYSLDDLLYKEIVYRLNHRSHPNTVPLIN